jgi:hypothetical protein
MLVAFALFPRLRKAFVAKLVEIQASAMLLCFVCVLQTLSVVERLEAAGLNVICDAKRQAAAIEHDKHLVHNSNHHDFVPA